MNPAFLAFEPISLQLAVLNHKNVTVENASGTSTNRNDSLAWALPNLYYTDTVRNTINIIRADGSTAVVAGGNASLFAEGRSSSGEGRRRDCDEIQFLICFAIAQKAVLSGMVGPPIWPNSTTQGA
jgi:hypothetical protein